MSFSSRFRWTNASTFQSLPERIGPPLPLPLEQDHAEDDARWCPQRHVHGILGVHVDDLLGGGDAHFRRAAVWLKTGLEFGASDETKFRFRGRELQQSYDKRSISISIEVRGRHGADHDPEDRP